MYEWIMARCTSPHPPTDQPRPALTDLLSCHVPLDPKGPGFVGDGNDAPVAGRHDPGRVRGRQCGGLAAVGGTRWTVSVKRATESSARRQALGFITGRHMKQQHTASAASRWRVWYYGLLPVCMHASLSTYMRMYGWY